MKVYYISYNLLIVNRALFTALFSVHFIKDVMKHPKTKFLLKMLRNAVKHATNAANYTSKCHETCLKNTEHVCAAKIDKQNTSLAMAWCTL